MFVLVSDGAGWDHVSVSIKGKKSRFPTWDEMNFVKNLFWDADETVVQFHPRKDQLVDNHPGVLHLWKKQNMEYLLPPPELVGLFSGQMTPEGNEFLKEMRKEWFENK